MKVNTRWCGCLGGACDMEGGRGIDGGHVGGGGE